MSIEDSKNKLLYINVLDNNFLLINTIMMVQHQGH
jgi:hypothetical protein